MDAWIDCMPSLDAPEDGVISVHGSSDDSVVLHIDNAAAVPPELLDGLIECAAFGNRRRIEVGETVILAMSFWRTQPRN